MTRWIPAAVVAVLTAATSAQRPASAPAPVDLVELDVVALDRSEKPVTDLRQEDFTIKEDGRRVDLKTFAMVTALGSSQPDDGRVVTLLMDDIGVPLAGTSRMQQIAPVVLAPMGDGDELSIVRLSSRSDEAFGDVDTARHRIAGYRGGAAPFQRRDTSETVLKAITKIARQLEPIDHRRKVILCLGMTAVCDVGEPQLGGDSPDRSLWVDALAATARANASLYVVDPTGARGSAFTSDGLARLTGGRSFHENDFAPPGEAIWREAGHYYLIGYWPGESKRELHAIDVSVARKGVHALARQRR